MKVLIAGLSGLLMGLTTAPFSAFYFAWIALIPLWLLTVSDQVQGTREKEKYKLILKDIIVSEKTWIAFAWGFGALLVWTRNWDFAQVP